MATAVASGFEAMTLSMKESVRAAAAAALVLAVLTACGAGQDSAGTGAGGNLVVNFAGTPCAATFQRDGKIVVVGTDRGLGPNARAASFVLARYLPSGRVDRDFGSSGKVVTSFGQKRQAGACAVIVQPNGGIVVAGGVLLLEHPKRVEDEKGEEFVIYPSDFALFRSLPDGRLDRSFGSNGRVLTDLGSNDEFRALALQGDGSIVAAGMSGTGIGLVRYTPQGRPDPTFGARGKVLPASDLEVRQVVMQSGGKIVVAGGAVFDGGGVFGLARYSPDGSLDRSFGDRGLVRTGIGPDYDDESTVWAVAVQEDGKIVAAGYGEPGVTFGLARYDADGTLDDGFGSHGEVVTALGPISATADATALAIQHDGKIVAGGVYEGDVSERFALVRYEPNGRLDDGFGSRGKVLTAFHRGESAGYNALAVTVRTDGRIVLVGSIVGSTGSRIAIARYLSNGHADPSFGRK